jgi:hypothetical protein
MSVYNILKTRMNCPRCGTESEMEVDLYFGLRNQIQYQIGDKVEWIPQKAVQNGGRPENGNLNGEAYAQCPKCKKDFFVIAHIKNDVIESLQPNLEKKSYIPD